MKIAVLGKGNIGGTLGRKWQEAGYEVVFGVREPGSKAGSEMGVASAIEQGFVVLLAVPGAVVPALVEEHARSLEGKILIDATNKIGEARMNCVEEIRAAVPSARIVRAFHNLGWENFAQPVFDGVPADLFYCSTEDTETIRVAEALVTAIGLRPLRIGDLSRVELVDALTRLWFALQAGLGFGRHTALKVLSS